MASIVLELQKEAMNTGVDISDLLIKAHVVAKKLKITEFDEWIESELNGYREKKIPGYRNVNGNLKYYNPFHGYQDYLIEHEGISEALSNRKLCNPIAELEDLYKKGGNKPIVLSMPPEIRISFVKHFNAETAPEFLFITPSKLKSIFESVRKIILDWTLKLEEDGILGEDLKFTSVEKEIAVEKNSKYTTIIHDSIVQVGDKNIQNINQIDLKEVETQLKSIKEHLGKLELNNDVDKKELKVGIKTIESQLESQKPNQTIIKESFKSIRNILEGCASSAIAPILIAGITKLIGL